MDKVTEKRIADGNGAVDVLTGLRCGGFVSDTPLRSAFGYLMFDYTNGVESGVVSSYSYGYTLESEGMIGH